MIQILRDFIGILDYQSSLLGWVSICLSRGGKGLKGLRKADWWDGSVLLGEEELHVFAVNLNLINLTNAVGEREEGRTKVGWDRKDA